MARQPRKRAQRKRGDGKKSREQVRKEEQKKRNEKYTKRTKSLVRKVRELAEGTDAFVSLVLRDPRGKVQSVRSSNDPSWPPSIGNIMEQHPSGRHEFILKAATFDVSAWLEHGDSGSEQGSELLEDGLGAVHIDVDADTGSDNAGMADSTRQLGESDIDIDMAERPPNTATTQSDIETGRAEKVDLTHVEVIEAESAETDHSMIDTHTVIGGPLASDGPEPITRLRLPSSPGESRCDHQTLADQEENGRANIAMAEDYLPRSSEIHDHQRELESMDTQLSDDRNYDGPQWFRDVCDGFYRAFGGNNRRYSIDGVLGLVEA